MYKSELIEMESFIRRLIKAELDEPPCLPIIFDCPVCKHETLSETRKKKPELTGVRYCFGCGNTFARNVSWKKEVK